MRETYTVAYTDQWGDTATRTFRGGTEAFRDAVRFATTWQLRWRRAGKPANAAEVKITSGALDGRSVATA